MIEIRKNSPFEWVLIDTDLEDLPVCRIVADEFGRSTMIYPAEGFAGIPVEYLRSVQDAAFDIGVFVRLGKDRQGVWLH